MRKSQPRHRANRYLPGKISKRSLQIFLTGKYKTIKQPKKSRIFSVGEKMDALRATGVGIRESDHGYKKNKEIRYRKDSRSLDRFFRAHL
jgi:hypothetical protein